MIKNCYYINLERRPDRKEYIENELNKSSLLNQIYQRFDAVDGYKIHPRDVEEGLLSKNAIQDILMDTVSAWGLSLTQGGLGVLLTYKNLFEKISKLDSPAVTFEDDTTLTDDFDEYLTHVLNELPNDFDLCYLGYGGSKLDYDEYSEHLLIPKGMITCLPSLIISPNGAKKLLLILDNVDNQIDTAIYTKGKSLNRFVSKKKIAIVKNHFKTDIQGNNNCKKEYPKQNYIISTLAYGHESNVNALKLAKDLRYFNQKILIVTNISGYYKSMDNVIEIPYGDGPFSYNRKIDCIEESFKIEDAVVYIDSDSRVFYESFKKTLTDFLFKIEPGFHPSWCWGDICRKESGFFESKDVSERVSGYGEMALSLCEEMGIDYRIAKHYQEGILIFSKEDGKEKIFLDTWRNLSNKLDEYEIQKNSKRIGLGEGNLVGLSIIKSGMKIHDDSVSNHFGENLFYNFFGSIRDGYFEQYPNKKLVRYSDLIRLSNGKVDVQFREKVVDLYYEIFKDDTDVLTLLFEWNTNNAVEFLDHEFRINGNVYHFNSDKNNEFNFPLGETIKIEHTYDWYGERDWKLIVEL